ncbi:hypothetical protein ABZY81_42700 [Streptomyces sp. NPDC006514]|uniref:hypothetical protein n=1 Tax=Streptomyces sp. NPDC006514 TaxID=3154308 RepID=UPI0033A76143
MNDKAGKFAVGATAAGVSYGVKKGIKLCKEKGYNVPEWVEQLAPTLAGLATTLGFGHWGGGTPPPQSEPAK